jgi:putative tryptophan/tyrosine transport system substrate-binding protein
MRRREFITLLGGTAASWPFTVRAGAAAKIWRVGQVFGGTPGTYKHIARAFEQRLVDLGYRLDETLTLVTRFVVPEPRVVEDALRLLIKEIDLLVTWSTLVGVAAKKVAHNIPVVFISVGAPVEIGLVESLGRPGGNMTGITFEAATETYGKRLQILKEIVPRLTRAVVLGAEDDANFKFALESVERVAPSLGITTININFRAGDKLAAKFDEMLERRAEGVIVVAGARTYQSRQEIADLALSSHLPSCHGFIETVTVGGLVGLGPDPFELVRQGAYFVDKIIHGAKPAELPVQQPVRYLLRINLRTARTLGLTVPDSLLALADEVIE